MELLGALGVTYWRVEEIELYVVYTCDGKYDIGWGQFFTSTKSS